MRNLPKEHGLTITWATTVLLSVIIANPFNLFGIVLVCISIPTIAIYDTALNSLRTSKAKSSAFFKVFNNRAPLWQKTLILLIASYLLAGILFSRFPVWSLAFPAFSMIAFLTSVKFLNERSMISRSLSLLSVTSQFVLFNSSLTGILDFIEVREFIILSLINIILVVGAGQIISSKINRTDFKKNFVTANIPLFLAASIVLYFATISLFYEFALFLIVFGLMTISLIGVQSKPMKVVGMSFSAWNLFAAILLIIIYFT